MGFFIYGFSLRFMVDARKTVYHRVFLYISRRARGKPVLGFSIIGVFFAFLSGLTANRVFIYLFIIFI